MGLTFVPTPLGNLRDVTLRALDALRDCDLIIAEDTRVTRRLLGALELPSKPIWSYREQNAEGATRPILERARTERIVVVCDAGTPGISDPGRELVVAARDAGIAVEVLPGPSAFVCALVLSGFDLAHARFDGFLPRARGEREAALRAACESEATTAFYESPHRIVDTLEALDFLAPSANAFVARELTKLHEQQCYGTPRAILAALERPVRGEIVLVIGPRTLAPTPVARDADTIERQIDTLLREGRSVADVAKTLARRGFGERADLYRTAGARKAALATTERTPG